MFVGEPVKSEYAPVVATVASVGVPVTFAYGTPVIFAPPPWKLVA